MKKVIVLICSVLFTVSIYSQGFTVGPVIGFNTSKLTTNIPDLTQEAKANFLFGAFVRIGKKFYIQPEVVYTAKGGISLSQVTEGAETTINLKQLEIPLMLGFKLINMKKVNLRVLGGPVMGFVTDKDIQVNEFVQEPFQEDWLKNTQWGFQLGAGVDIFFLTLDLRYEFGLTNMYAPPSGGEEYDIKNNLFRVSLGWMIL